MPYTINDIIVRPNSRMFVTKDARFFTLEDSDEFSYWYHNETDSVKNAVGSKISDVAYGYVFFHESEKSIQFALDKLNADIKKYAIKVRPMILEELKVVCIEEPKGTYGLEGYNIGDRYGVRKMLGKFGTPGNKEIKPYYQFFPDPNDDDYEVTDHFPKQFFQILEKEIFNERPN